MYLLIFLSLLMKCGKEKRLGNSGHQMCILFSLEDLISLKKYSNRIQDRQDILLLSKIKNGKK